MEISTTSTQKNMDFTSVEDPAVAFASPDVDFEEQELTADLQEFIVEEEELFDHKLAATCLTL